MNKLNFLTVTLTFLFLGCGKSNPQNEENTSSPQRQVVSISNKRILVNDVPYFIKGVCYHPVPKGSNNIRSFASIDQDLALMVEAGINTIRVYAPIVQLQILDKIDQAGLKVIMGFGYNQNGYYDILSGSFIDYVNNFKHHNAILFWELGNEYNYHPELFNGNIDNWYNALNNAAKLIHENDIYHPVATAHGELPDANALSLSPEVDIWGINIYRWDNPQSILPQWENVSDKPIYFSEAGSDSYMTIARDGFDQGENQSAQAAANAQIIDQVFENSEANSGVLIFSFSDGWWKAGNPNQQDIGGWAPNSSGVPYDGTANEEFWGIVDIDRNKKETFNIIKAKYNGFSYL